MLGVVASLSACAQTSPSGAASQGGQPNAQSLALNQAPAGGYSVAVDGALGNEAAAGATSANPTATSAQLHTDVYQGGWVRTWRNAGEDVELLVMQFEDDFHANDFVAFQLQQLRTGQGVEPYPDNGVPGGTAYLLYGTARGGSRQLFCQGAWFYVGAYAFNVTDCSPAPRAADLMLAFSRQVYVHAAESIGVPVASPSPQS